MKHFKIYNSFQQSKPMVLAMLLALGTLANPPLFAQSVNWLRQATVPSDNYAQGSVVATDAAGNIYAAGSFYGSMTLGSTTLSSPGNWNGYIAKYDAAGNVLWVRSFGGSLSDGISGIAISGNSLYVVGEFASPTMSFGSGTLNLAGTSWYDGYVAKYDTDGNYQWSRGLGSVNSADGAYAVAASGSSVYVTGGFTSTTTFTGTTSLTSSGNYDVFVVKFSDAGTLDWAVKAGSSSNDSGNGIAVSGSDIYVTGGFTGTATFGSHTVTSAGEDDMFLAKLDDSGVFQWVKRGGGSTGDRGNGMGVSGSDVYVLGHFQGTGNFNTPSASGSNELISVGSQDVFLAKYNTSGAVQWVRRAGGGDGDGSSYLAISGSNVLIGGSFSGTMNFNTPSSTASNQLTSAGAADGFVAKFSSAGAYESGFRHGGSGNDGVNGIAFAGSTMYVVGNFQGTANFNTPSNGSSNTLTAGGIIGNYLAAYNGADMSNAIALTIKTAPAITTHPTTTQTVMAGTSVSFTVVATGSDLTYQWKKGGVNVGTNSATFTIPSPVLGDAGSYTCEVSGSCGTPLTTNAAALVVNGLPTITTQPTAQTICSGGNVTFSVVATGTNLSYQWKKGSDNVGTNSPSLTITGATAANAGTYTVVVSGDFPPSVTSNAVALTVNELPTITTQPTAQAVCLGSNISFSVVATGTGLSYQWKKGSDNVGTNSATYAITNASAADIANYSVIVSGTCSPSVTSDVVALTTKALPAITTQPTTQTVCSGTNVTFSVVATGTNLSYQWKKGSDNVGTNSASLTITGATAANAGNYTVVVSGDCTPSVTSDVATLNINELPAITTQPTAQSICLGGTVTFSVVATGTNLSYQWKKGSDNVGTNSASYQITNASLADVANYSVVVSGTCTPPVTSNAVAFTVSDPAVTINTGGAAICENATRAISANIPNGVGPFNYTWSASTGTLSATTGGSVNFTAPNSAASTTFNVTVTDGLGCTATGNAVLTTYFNPIVFITPTVQTICSGTDIESIFAGNTRVGIAPENLTWTSSRTNATNVVGIGALDAPTTGVSSVTIPVSTVSTTQTTAQTSVITIRAATPAAQGGCINEATATVNVEVAASFTEQPVAQVNCENGSITFSANAVGSGTLTYEWFKAENAIALQRTSDVASGTANTLTLSGLTLGQAGDYYVVIKGSACPTEVTSSSAALTVKPNPTLSSVAASAAAVCDGTAVGFTASGLVNGSTTFNYTLDGTASSLTTTVTGGAFTFAPVSFAVGSHELVINSITINGCTTNFSTNNATAFVVHPIPQLSSTLTPSPICSGTSFSYTPTSAVSGSTFAWTRATIAGITEGGTNGTGNIGETLTNTTNAPIVVTYVITTTANNCSNTPQNVTVTVNPIPQLSSTLTPSAICSATSFSYTPTSAVSGATFAWSRATIAGITEAGTNGTGNIGETLTNTTNAPIVVTYVITTTANGCSNTPQSVTITVNPIPQLSSTLTPSAICSQTSFSYTPTSAVSGATFAWSRATIAGITEGGTNGTGTIGETLTNTTTDPIVVTYLIITSANSCSNTAQSLTVTVNPTPVLSSTLTPSAICSATSFSYSPTSATSGATFAWSRATIAGITEGGTNGTGNIGETLTNTTTNPIVVTYSIITTANGCSNTAQSVTVTVNPTPVLSSTLTPSAICSATSFSYSPTSATSGATFAWSRAEVVGISQSAATGTGNIGETLTNTTNAPIVVTYLITTTANGCSNTPQSVTVTVNPIPQLSSTLTPSPICSGTSFSYTPTSAVSGSTFAWTRATIAGITEGGTNGTGTIGETLTNTTNAPIVVTYVITTTANGCSNTPQSVTVTVNPIPQLSSTLTPSAICSATSFSYSPTSAVSGATFAWSRATIAGITEGGTNGTGNIGETLTNTTADPIVVTYSIITTANGCSNTAQSVTVTVNPTPVLSSSLTPSAICSRANFVYSATTATSGATLTWTRATVAGITEGGTNGTGNVNERLTNSTSAPIVVTYVYTLTANGCSNTQNVTVTVNPTPTLNSNLSPAPICGGTTFNYTPTSAVSGATFAWSRAAVAGINEAAATGTGNISEVLTNMTNSPIVVKYTFITSANGCNSSTQNVFLVVNPALVLSSTLTPTAICSGATFGYTPTTGVSGTTFAWSRAAVTGISQMMTSGSGSISEILTNTTTNPIVVTYVVTMTANGCTNAGQNVTVTVNPIPTLNSSLTPPAICSEATFSYTPTSATAGATFAWSRAAVTGISQTAATGSGNIGETLTNTTNAPIVVTYLIITTANGCSNTAQTVTVTVNPKTELTSTLTPAPICSATNFSYTPTSAVSGSTFAWSRATIAGITEGGTSGSGNISETLTNTTADPIVVTYAVIVTANGCSNAPQNVTVTVNPTPKLSSTLTAAAICTGTTFSYAPTSATVGSTFAWSRAAVTGITEGASSGNGNIGETLTNTTTAPIVVTYLVTTTANGCSNSAQSVTITVNPMPILSSTLTPNAICSANNFNYVPSSATIGASFAWTRATIAGIAEVGASGAGNIGETLTNSTTNPIVVTYLVTTSANGCSNSAQSVTVIVNPTPVLSSNLTIAAICSGSNATYTPTSATSGATFAWTRATIAGITEGGTSGVGNVNETLTNTTTAPIVVTYSYITTANGCSNTAQSVTITVNPTPVLSSTLAASPICSATSFTYTPTSATSGATFAWSRAAVAGITEGANSGAGNIGETLTNTTTDPIVVTYLVITTANGCSNIAQSVTVTVNPTPVLSSTLTPSAICSATNFSYLPTSATTGSTFAWSRAAVAGITEAANSGTGNIGETLTNTTTNPIVVTYLVITTANGCSNTAQSVTVTVNPTPVLNSNLTIAAICSGSNATYTPTSATSGATFAWTRAVVDGITEGASSGTGNVNETLTNTTTAPIVVTYSYITTANGCSNVAQSVTITVNPTPKLSSTLTAAAICTGTTFSYTPTSATVGSTFAWSRAAVAGITEAANSGNGNIGETLTNTTTDPIVVTYLVITTANGCSNVAQSVTVTVNPTPVLSSTLTPAPICSATNFSYSPTSATTGTTFKWSRATIAGITEGGTNGTGTISETLTNTTTEPISVTYVLVSTANSCSNAGENVTVTVNPTPVLSSNLTITAICSGSNATYTPTSATSGATFAWTRATIAGITEAGTNGVGNVNETLTNTTTAPIVVTYSYITTANGCSNSAQSVTITVNPIPVLSSTLAASPICSATSFTYTPTSATSGATFAWSRAAVTGISQTAATGSGNIGETLTNTTANPIVVTYLVITTANGCSNTAQSVTVTVNPTPVLSSTLTPAAICSATNFSYAPTSATSGATFAWTRAAVTGITEGASSGTGNIGETLTNTTTAPIVVTYLVITTANGCSNTAQSVTVTVNPTPVLNSSLRIAAICSSSNATYTPTSATSGATFTWTRAAIAGITEGSNSGTGNVNETLTNTTTAPIVVTYSYITTANGCSNSAQSVTITVNPIPVLSSTLTASPICSATNFSYSPTSATSGATFAWSRAAVTGISQTAATGSGNIGETLTNTTTDPIVVTYLVITTANGCSNSAQSVSVTVNPTPKLSSTLTPAAICSATNFSYAPTSATSGTTFTWSRATIAGITEGGTNSTGNISETLTNTTTGPISVTYVVISTANGCPNAGENVTVIVNPMPRLSSTLTPSAICSATNFSYSPTSATSGATFAWTRATVAGITEGASSGNGNVNETLTNTTTDPIVVTYLVITTANGCSNTAQSITVTVNPTPVLSSTLTPSAICSETIFGYTPTSATLGATFAWTRAAVTGISQTAGTGSGTISETLTNTTTDPIVVTYLITTTANDCSNTAQSVTVTVNPSPVLSSSLTIAAICSGVNATYTPTSATVGTIFTWTRAAVTGITEGASSGTGSIGETLTNETTAPIVVTYVVVSTANGCSNAGQNVTVTVNPTPRAVVTSPDPILSCPDATTFQLGFTTTAITPYTYSVRADVTNGLSGFTTATVGGNTNSSPSVTVGTPALTIPNNNNPYQFRLFITDVNGCVSASSANVSNGVLAKLKINAYPHAALATVAPLSICDGNSTLTVNLNGSNGSTLGFDAGNPKTLVYAINGTAQTAITNITGNTVMIPAAQGGTYSLVSVSATCIGFVSSATATVNDARTSITTQPTNQSSCDGASVTFTSAAAISATAPSGSTLVYNWQVSTGTGFNSIGVNTATYTFTPNVADNGKLYRVQAYYVNGSGIPICGSANIVNSNVAILTVGAAITGVTAGADQTVSAITATMAANLGTGTTGVWSIIPANASISFSDVNAANTTVSNLPLAATTFRWTVSNAGGCSVTDDVVITRQGITLTAVVFLHGALDTSGAEPLMRDDLRSKGLLPLTSPYSVAPWNAPTATTTPSVLAVQPDTEDNVVDWILIELRSATNPATVIERKAALVKRNGFIVDVDGASTVRFTSPEGDYYIAIRHRNHLGVMSSQIVEFLHNTPTLFDFSDGLTTDYPTYTVTTSSRIRPAQRGNIKGNYRAMWSGNTNPAATNGGKYVNGVGTGSDYTPIQTRLAGAAIINGYYIEDTNLNGRVHSIGTGNDKIPIFVTAGYGVVWEQLPENN